MLNMEELSFLESYEKKNEKKNLRKGLTLPRHWGSQKFCTECSMYNFYPICI